MKQIQIYKHLRQRQSGFSVLVALMATALLVSALTVALTGGSGGFSMSGMLAGNNKATLVAGQAALIRSRILQCAIEYPSGNNGTGFRVSYPAAAAITNVSALTCPGSGVGLWNMSDAVEMPPTIEGFNVWRYVNDATSMRIQIVASNSDTTALLSSIATKLGAQSSYSGSTLTWILSL